MHIPEKLLQRLYVDKKMTISAIAVYLHCSADTVSRRLCEYDIPIRKHRVEISVEKLRELYLIEGYSIKKISRIFDCSHTTISNYLKAAGIPVRKIAPKEVDEEYIVALYKSGNDSRFIAERTAVSEAYIVKVLQKKGLKGRKRDCAPKIEAAVLRDLYVERQLTTVEIGKVYGIKATTVSGYLKRLGIRVRGNKRSVDNAAIAMAYVTEKKSVSAIAKEWKCSCTVIKKRLEDMGLYQGRRQKQIPGEEVEKLYRDEGYSLVDLAKRYDCCEGTVAKYLEEYGVPRRVGRSSFRIYSSR